MTAKERTFSDSIKVENSLTEGDVTLFLEGSCLRRVGGAHRKEEHWAV